MDNYSEAFDLQSYLDMVSKHFPMVYISSDYEFVFHSDRGIYFRLQDVKTDKDFYGKVIKWLSRDAIKQPEEIAFNVGNAINEILKTNFTTVDFDIIYTYLGNDINKGLCDKFIESGFNITVLEV